LKFELDVNQPCIEETGKLETAAGCTEDQFGERRVRDFTLRRLEGPPETSSRLKNSSTRTQILR
jgi:hypothetical protein